MLRLSLAACILFAAFDVVRAEEFTLGEPPGKYVGRIQAHPAEAAGFRSGTPIVATTYFYWYDEATKAHLIDGDGTDALTDHPPTVEGLSYKNVSWHERQLGDMIDAGIDVVMPVYWGVPDNADTWSDAGLPKLVAARHKLIRAGKTPPAIGMFYDTSTLRFNGNGYHADLTTPGGRRWFYGTIRNFFSYIPDADRVHIDGKPLVFLYQRSFAKNVDEQLFPAVRAMFREDFGTDIYLVKIDNWPGAADSEYQWGAALAPKILATAAVGPGYDHSAVPGRRPLVRNRDDGMFYRFAWQRLMSLDPGERPWLVHVETWNEFHEGTEICETAEYGRQYIELTRHFTDLFHARKQVDPNEGMPNFDEVFATPEESHGLAAVDKSDGDGPLITRVVEGRTAWRSATNTFVPQTRYMYFDVDYRFLFEGDETLEVTVDYYDAGPRSFLIEYDSSDPELAGLRQVFRAMPGKDIEDTNTWKRTTFVLPHARFAGRANGCDFRLTCTGADLTIGRVAIRRQSDDE